MELVVDLVPTASIRGPVNAPAGTVVVSDVLVDAVTVAVTGLNCEFPVNCRTFVELVVLKLVPVMVTVAPTGALDGEMAVICGVATVKDVWLVVLPVAFVTVIGPLLASTFTLTWICEGVAERMPALLPEPKNWTVGLVVKPLPLMVMTSLTTPLVGVKLLMTGSTANALDAETSSKTRHTTAMATTRIIPKGITNSPDFVPT
jgi:hypothetical protein